MQCHLHWSLLHLYFAHTTFTNECCCTCWGGDTQKRECHRFTNSRRWVTLTGGWECYVGRYSVPTDVLSLQRPHTADDAWMRVVQYWNVAKRAKPKYPQKNLSQSHFVHSCQQKSIGLEFSKSQTGSDVRYSCHHNSSRFTFPIFAHSCRFSVLHSLNQSHHVYINRRRQYICLIWN